MVLNTASALVVSVAGAVMASAAFAAPPPDSARCVVLQSACDAAKQLRVTTTREFLTSSRLQARPDGLTLFPPPGRSAVIVIGDPGPKPRRIAWSEIERVESERGRGGRYAAIGLLVGAAMGTALVATRGPDAFEKGDNGMVAFATGLAISTGIAGLLIGMSNPERHTLYP
jgi:hypothetical protein